MYIYIYRNGFILGSPILGSYLALSRDQLDIPKSSMTLSTL